MDNRKDIRKKRSRRIKKDMSRWYLPAGAAVLVIIVIGVVGIRAKLKQVQPADVPLVTEAVDQQIENVGSNEVVEPETLNQEEELARQREEDIDNVIASYQNLGLANVSGYLNIRAEAGLQGEIIGKLQQYGACEILDTEGDWYRISSGGVEGYIDRQYVLTGDEAAEKARENVVERAIVTATKLNIRETPDLEPTNILGQAFKNERYEIVDQIEGWIQTKEGYLADEFVEVKLALNEARKLDLRAMALNQYDNLVISKVTNYLNIRSTPEDKGNENIIGKLPGKAAAEILGEENGWYKISSGSITGYITTDSQYIATGQEARDLAMQAATLMAIVNTDKLNVRTDTTTDATIWTQISKEERYSVLSQLDGWVQIELDGGEEGSEEVDHAYIATRDNNVEVRYALAEAIKFKPLEEKKAEETSRRNQIANYAIQFVGNPYVWGGTSLTNGADCSGFVKTIMSKYGISLPRVSSEQAKAGVAVKSSEMLPGDLIFYANKSGRVNHVAMYIGNGQVVHASSRKTGIKISTWNYRTPKTIRRVISN